jgi:hypothetical protein
MLKRNNIYIFLALAVFLLSFINFYIVLDRNYLSVLEVQKVETSLIVGDRGGFDLNSSALTLGMIIPGGSSTRNLIVENKYDFDIRIYLTGEGEIQRFLVFDKNIFLEKGETRQIPVSGVIPRGTQYGNYTGKIFLTFRKAEKH